VDTIQGATMLKKNGLAIRFPRLKPWAMVGMETNCIVNYKTIQIVVGFNQKQALTARIMKFLRFNIL
jgi:hypothetical protein